MTEAAGLAGCAGHWAALAWGAGQVLGARGRRQALGRRRTGAQADAGQALRRAAGARGALQARGAPCRRAGLAAGAREARTHGMDARKGRAGRQARRTRAEGARRAVGWAACARLVCSVRPGWVFRCA